MARTIAVCSDIKGTLHGWNAQKADLRNSILRGVAAHRAFFDAGDLRGIETDETTDLSESTALDAKHDPGLARRVRVSPGFDEGNKRKSMRDTVAKTEASRPGLG